MRAVCGLSPLTHPKHSRAALWKIAMQHGWASRLEDWLNRIVVRIPGEDTGEDTGEDRGLPVRIEAGGEGPALVV